MTDNIVDRDKGTMRGRTTGGLRYLERNLPSMPLRRKVLTAIPRSRRTLAARRMSVYGFHVIRVLCWSSEHGSADSVRLHNNQPQFPRNYVVSRYFVRTNRFLWLLQSCRSLLSSSSFHCQFHVRSITSLKDRRTSNIFVGLPSLKISTQ